MRWKMITNIGFVESLVLGAEYAEKNYFSNCQHISSKISPNKNLLNHSRTSKRTFSYLSTFHTEIQNIIIHNLRKLNASNFQHNSYIISAKQKKKENEQLKGVKISSRLTQGRPFQIRYLVSSSNERYCLVAITAL